MALHSEDRFPVADLLEQTPALDPDGQWVLTLRNHVDLTAEFLTDAEREYMLLVYARDSSLRANLGACRRLAPLVQNSRRRIELMWGHLFSLPGTPVVYYGDEIGMGAGGGAVPLAARERAAGLSPALRVRVGARIAA
jgi:maltose alpha-D-glucosyltransferase/alpha-amylase